MRETSSICSSSHFLSAYHVQLFKSFIGSDPYRTYAPAVIPVSVMRDTIYNHELWWESWAAWVWLQQEREYGEDRR